MGVLQSLQKLKEGLKSSDRMPLVFIGHGNPMNAIEDTKFSRSWSDLGRALPRPQAILVVSAHWMTRGTTLVDVSAVPRTIHDFGGFPQKLFDQDYPAMGNPELAREVVALLASHHAQEDDTWGLDHGSWTILKYLYPNADVPVFQLSIDMSKPLDQHMAVGEALSDLRNRGVLILGSGNIVHNLRAARMGGKAADFALEFDSFFADRMTHRDFSSLTDTKNMGVLFRMAHPSIDHYIPAMTIAGAADERDELTFMTNDIDLSSISMRSFVFHDASGRSE